MAAKPKKVNKFNPATYAYPECRERHEWSFYDGTVEERTKLAYQTDRCPTCGTKRHTVISMRTGDYGQLAKPRSYDHPEDYHITGGLDRSGKGRLRMRNFFDRLEANNG